jgi:hypothetical protein
MAQRFAQARRLMDREIEAATATAKLAEGGGGSARARDTAAAAAAAARRALLAYHGARAQALIGLGQLQLAVDDFKHVIDHTPKGAQAAQQPAEAAAEGGGGSEDSSRDEAEDEAEDEHNGFVEALLMRGALAHFRGGGGSSSSRAAAAAQADWRRAQRAQPSLDVAAQASALLAQVCAAASAITRPTPHADTGRGGGGGEGS